jgi:hypothetical protein
MNKSDLEKLVDVRILEAKTLLKSKHYQGAYYLMGYSLECAFKACIAKRVSQYDFPDKELTRKSHTHSLMELLSVAGLRPQLTEKENEDSKFKLYWNIANEWSEVSRYECTIQPTQAHDLFKSITDTESGILPWIKKYWL